MCRTEEEVEAMSKKRAPVRVRVVVDEHWPTKTTDERVDSETPVEEDDARSVLRRGTLLGGASLGLLFVATSLTLPFQQSKRDALGCSSMCLGSLSSGKSTLRLIGATVLGRLSDSQYALSTTGAGPRSRRQRQQYASARRICLWIGVLSTATSLNMENNASSIRDLRWSIVPGGLLEQNAHILKALFSEYHESIPGESTPGERASSAGIVGMSMGLAMMIGPLAGSTLLSTYEEATRCATFLLAVAAVLVALLPSPSQQTKKRPPIRRKGSSFLHALDVPSARTSAGMFLLICRLLSALSYHIYQTILISSLRDRFHFGQKEYGMFFSVVGLFFALSQGFFAKYLLDRFGKTRSQRANLIILSTFLIGIQRYFAFYAISLIEVYVMFAIMVVSYGVTSTVFAADTTQVADPEELGAFFGLVAAVESGAGMAGPIAGGYLTYWHPTKAPLMASVGLSALTTLLLAGYYERLVLERVDSPKLKKS